MSDFTITPTTADHIPALEEVVAQTDLFPSDMLGAMLGPSLENERVGFALTCHVENRPVGFCFAIPEEFAEGTWNMLALAVHPDVQGKGLGAALLRAAEQALIDKHQRVLLVDTSSSEAFAQARAFYRKNGYEQEARIRDFWAKGDDKVTYRKAL